MKRQQKFNLLVIFAFISFPSFHMAFAKSFKVKTVSSVDLQRYMGKWYEIASYPQWFQKDCTASRATYELREDGYVKVLNECNLKEVDGKLKKAKGRAWVVDKSTNAKLKVQFFLPWVKLPFLAGDYWIIMLDKENYSYSVISDPKKKTLWILSRTKKMPENLYQSILEKLRQRGFDLGKLKITKQ